MRQSFVAAVILVGIANAFAELVYGAYLVPRFTTLSAIPLRWFVVMYAPVLFTCVLVASRASSWRGAWAGALGASSIAQIEKLVLAMVGAPGHEASAAAVSPAHFWTVHFARMTFGFVVIFSVAYAIHGARSRRAGSTNTDVR